MSAGPDTPSVPENPVAGRGWNQDEVDEILERLENAEEHREDLLDQIEGDDSNGREEEPDRGQLYNRIENSIAIVSMSILLTLLSLYSLNVGFSSGSTPLIASSVGLLMILAYHHWRWYNATK